jgi:hypothetical protein
MSDDILSERARGIVMALGVISLVASVVAMVYGRKLTPREISPHDSYGRGPLGTRVLFETLPRIGIRAFRETEISRVRSARAPVLFLAPDAPSQDIDGRLIELGDVIAERADAGRVSVVVLPKWEMGGMGVAEPLDYGSLVAFAEATGLALEVRHEGVQTDRPKIRALHTEGLAGANIQVPYPQTLVGGHTILASITEGSVVVTNESRTIIVVSDSDLVANFAVQRAGHADLIVALLRSLHSSTLVVDETFHGRHASKSLAEALGEWPGVLILVHGAFLAAAALLAGRKRFGKPRAAKAAYGRGPREAIAVAADVLTMGRAPSRLAVRYVELMLRDLHLKLGLREDGHTIDASDAADAIDRLAVQRKKPAHAVQLLADVRVAPDTSRKARKQALTHALDLAGRAFRLRRQWLGPRGSDGGTT